MGDDFFKDFHKDTERSFRRLGCAALIGSALSFLFTVAVIVGAIYVLVHYVF